MNYEQLFDYEHDESEPCLTSDGRPIFIGMHVIGYDNELCIVTDPPQTYELVDKRCWPSRGHQGHWWGTEREGRRNNIYDGSRMTTRGVKERLEKES